MKERESRPTHGRMGLNEKHGIYNGWQVDQVLSPSFSFTQSFSSFAFLFSILLHFLHLSAVLFCQRDMVSLLWGTCSGRRQWLPSAPEPLSSLWKRAALRYGPFESPGNAPSLLSSLQKKKKSVWRTSNIKQGEWKVWEGVKIPPQKKKYQIENGVNGR